MGMYDIAHAIFNVVPYYTYIDLQNKPLDTLANFGVTVDALRRVDTDHDGLITTADRIFLVGGPLFSIPQNPEAITMPANTQLRNRENPAAATLLSDVEAAADNIVINIADYEAFLNAGGGPPPVVQPQPNPVVQVQNQEVVTADDQGAQVETVQADGTGQTDGAPPQDAGQDNVTNNTQQPVVVTADTGSAAAGSDLSTDDDSPAVSNANTQGLSSVTSTSDDFTSEFFESSESTGTGLIDLLGSTVQQWVGLLIMSFFTELST